MSTRNQRKYALDSRGAIERIDDLKSRLRRISELHQLDGDGYGYCKTCIFEHWPCDTARLVTPPNEDDDW